MRIRTSGSGFTSAGLAVLTVLLACGTSEPVDLSDDENPRQVVDTFTLVVSTGNAREWRLSGTTAEYLEMDSLLLLSDVEITFFEEDIPSMVMTSDSGRMDRLTGLLRLWGDVYAENTEGRTLTTSEIVWYDSMQLFHSDCLVVMTIPDSLGTTTLMGRNVDLDTSLGGDEIDIRQDFTAVYSGELEID